MIVAGVTGGIGSGKSTLCKVWESLGAQIVYADDLAKKLMVEDEAVINELKRTFGEKTYHRDGTLNKQHLIREAFQQGRVEELNRIVHPAVARKFREIARKASETDVKILVKEAALLLNKGRPEDLDIVILVLAPKNDQIERVKQRDDISELDVMSRMEKQPDFENLKSIADYTVENIGTLKEFKQKSKELFYRVLEDYRDAV
ncbi:dephospho-CoA kinase [Rhodohalobacter halophilus]|uniref:dephospho-CoA kinase n=1 Tax=Rhodohalobacter halophilus TaxID=1812810 RepID=UPI00083F8CCB|nr:dephospho-CoA kinase [Rhodohalobacter halophilus]